MPETGSFVCKLSNVRCLNEIGACKRISPVNVAGHFMFLPFIVFSVRRALSTRADGIVVGAVM